MKHHVARSSAALAISCLCAAPAWAALSSTASTGAAIASGQGYNYTAGGGRDASPPSIAISAYADDGLSSSALSGSSGQLTLNSHGCSGPLVGTPGGSASASSSIRYAEDFVVTSPTLAVGTPVLIDVKLSAGKSYKAFLILGTDNAIPFDGATSGGSASVGFYTTGQTSAIFNGSFGAQQAYVTRSFDPSRASSRRARRSRQWTPATLAAARRGCSPRRSAAGSATRFPSTWKSASAHSPRR